MKVIHIPRRYVKDVWGGTESVIQNLVKFQKKLNINPIVFTTQIFSNLKIEIINDVMVKRFSYFYPWLGLNKKSIESMDQKGGNVFSFSLLFGLLKEKKLDLIHLHTQNRLGGIARLIAKLKKIPYIVSVHGGILNLPSYIKSSHEANYTNTFEWGKALGYLVGSRNVLNDSAAILCPDHTEYLMLKEKFPNKRVEYFPNGVDVEKFASTDVEDSEKVFDIEKGSFLMTIIGRVDPQKNQSHILNIMPKLIEKIPNIHLLIVGHVTDFVYLSKLIDLIQLHNLKDHVTIVDGLESEDPRLMQSYHDSDVVLVPSIHEPFGIVALEAWACKKPVIASNIGGLKHIVNDQESGLLYDYDDSTGWQDGIIKLHENSDFRSTLALTGYSEVVSKYSWENLTKRLEDLYKELKS